MLSTYIKVFIAIRDGISWNWCDRISLRRNTMLNTFTTTFVWWVNTACLPDMINMKNMNHAISKHAGRIWLKAFYFISLLDEKNRYLSVQCNRLSEAIAKCDEISEQCGQLSTLASEQHNNLQSIEIKCRQMIDSIEESELYWLFFSHPHFAISIRFDLRFPCEKLYESEWRKKQKFKF